MISNNNSQEISDTAIWNSIINYQRKKVEEIRKRQIELRRQKEESQRFEKILEDIRDDQSRQAYITELYERGLEIEE